MILKYTLGIYERERLKNMSTMEPKELSVNLLGRTQQHKKDEMGHRADFFFFFLGLENMPSMPDIIAETDGMADAVKEK